MRRITVIIAFASVYLVPAWSFAQELEGFEARTFTGSKGLTLPYRLFKVKNPVAGMKYPLVMFLHGAGERGTNNTSQLTANAGAKVWATDENQAKHAAYVIAPQCPADKQWVDTPWGNGSYMLDNVPVSDQLTTALEIADEVADEFATDPARQYVTGLSMGGFGTWDAVMRNPLRFAAAIPICGGADPSKADLIKDLPLWTAHGDADGTVPVAGTRDMVTALEAAGSTVQYSEYPGVGHDAWTPTYANQEIVDWLFTNQRPLPPVGGSAGAGGMSGAGGSAGAGAGGAGAGGAATGGAAGTPATGGSSAGSSSGGMAGVPNGGGGGAALPPSSSSDDSGCSFALWSASGRPGGSWLVLSGFVAFVLAGRRRATRA